MNSYGLILAAFCLSSASAQLSSLVDGVTGAITKEVSSIKDPIDKTAVFIGFSQCKHVKRIIGVDYNSYQGAEPDMGRLTLKFITPEVRSEYKLTALTELPRTPKFNISRGLVIYLHGFIDDPDLFSFPELDKAFLQQGNYNILALDSSSLIRFFYLRASTMVRLIGEILGAAIALMMQVGLKPEDVHLVGHSLGSHIASFTGKTVFTLTGKRVGRISGLDPAGPCFADVESGLKLKNTDAEFVDVIHTDNGVYGLDEQVGHVDFYPNSGSEQPRCLLQVCSHNRVWELFAESLSNPQGFPAVRCDSWMDFKQGQCNYDDVKYMGYASKPGGPAGKYFLQTADRKPFALGTNGLNFTDTDGIVRSLRDQVTLLLQ